MLSVTVKPFAWLDLETIMAWLSKYERFYIRNGRLVTCYCVYLLKCRVVQRTFKFHGLWRSGFHLYY